MAETIYNAAKTGIANGTIDLDTDTIHILLIEAATPTPDPDHATVSAVTAATAEAVGTGYARKTSITVTVQQDDTNDRAEVLIPAQTWTGANWGDATALLVFKQVTNDADSIPISWHDTGFPITTNGGDLTVNFAGAGNNEAIYLT